MHNLYKKLIKLVDNNKAFFYKDLILDDQTYRIFNYRFASYTDFLSQGAFECRGHTFNITNKNDIKLVCLTPTKFFNLYENPFTIDIDLSTVKNITLKMDGSLISTFIHKKQLNFKSKTVFDSEQVKETKEFFSAAQNKNFKSILYEITKNGYTVNLEYISPTNRIVILYKKTNLIILNIREISTGKYIPLKHFRSYKYYDELLKHNVETLIIPQNKILDISKKDDIEGIVMEIDTGQFIKLKTNSYFTLHEAKSNLTDKKIVKCILNKDVDDLKVLLKEDEIVINKILRIEKIINEVYNNIVYNVEEFYKENQNLIQKDYAIKAKKELKNLFYFCMDLFHNELPNYNKYIINNYDKLLIEDKS